MSNATITLLTDFGLTDTYVAQMKGVIAGIAPGATVIDLTHDILPQDIAEAAYALDTAVDAFPLGTVHVAVVDPGVGSERRMLAIQAGGQFFIGPDNGLFTLVMDRLHIERVVQLTNPAYHRENVSDTFNGRDVFAPVAAHLAGGVAFEKLGEAIQGDELVRLDLARPLEREDGLELHVSAVDRFGNLITDLTPQMLASWQAAQPGEHGEPGPWTLHAGKRLIDSVGRTFSDAPVGEAVAYFGSSGRLEVAIRNGHASSELGLGVGDSLRLVHRVAGASGAG